MSADKRRRVTSAGGKARGASMTAEERSKLGKAGATAIHSVPGLAKRLAAKWPTASDEERAVARAILAELD